MTSDHELEEWFEGTPYDYWTQFRNDSLEKLEEYDWLVEADIASYYDNIHIETLATDLERLDLDEEVRGLLKRCLQKWSVSGSSPVFGKGVPQAYNASHVLAKLYLNSFDEHLRHNGFGSSPISCVKGVLPGLHRSSNQAATASSRSAGFSVDKT